MEGLWNKRVCSKPWHDGCCHPHTLSFKQISEC